MNFVGDLMEHIFEYQSLLARRDQLREQLSRSERHRMKALERLLKEPQELSDKRRHGRASVELPVRLIRGTMSRRVIATEVSGGGLGLGGDLPRLRRGEVVIIHYSNPDNSFECRLLCRVRWIRSGPVMGYEGQRPSEVGVEFTGMPLLLRPATERRPLAYLDDFMNAPAIAEALL